MLSENLFAQATQAAKPHQNSHWDMITRLSRQRKSPAVTMAAAGGEDKGQPSPPRCRQQPVPVAVPTLVMLLYLFSVS